MRWIHWAIQWRNRNNPVEQAGKSPIAGAGKIFKNVLDEKNNKDKITATFSFLKPNTLKQEDPAPKTEAKTNTRKKRA